MAVLYWLMAPQYDERIEAYSRPPKLKLDVLKDQDFRCSKCGNDEWLGQTLVLELEHIDGDRHNNSRENLECLCPNCHSQTKTWRGRNKGKRVSEDEMVEMLRATRSMHQTLVKLGLAPKGGNYKRVKRLVEEYQIDVIRQTPQSSSELLSSQQVRDIRQIRQSGETLAAISKQFGVSKATITSLLQGKTYRHVE